MASLKDDAELKRIITEKRRQRFQELCYRLWSSV